MNPFASDVGMIVVPEAVSASAGGMASMHDPAATDAVVGDLVGVDDVVADPPSPLTTLADTPATGNADSAIPPPTVPAACLACVCSPALSFLVPRPVPCPVPSRLPSPPCRARPSAGRRPLRLRGRSAGGVSRAPPVVWGGAAAAVGACTS